MPKTIPTDMINNATYTKEFKRKEKNVKDLDVVHKLAEIFILG